MFFFFETYDKTNPSSIEAYAQKLLGMTFQEVLDADESNSEENFKNKGDLGQLIERSFFHYECNSDSSPDFKEAGVELKVSPYKENKNGTLSAKERLVLTKIDYCSLVNEKDFYSSHVWYKSKLILLIYYLYQKGLKRFDYHINYAKLFSVPTNDRVIIERDYYLIQQKVKAGLAHELSESDTMYLAACTKGAKGTDRTKQPYSDIAAKPRAFSFKQSYMTYILNNYVVPGKDTYEPVLEVEELKSQTFEEALQQRLSKYIGWCEDKIAEDLDITLNKDDKGYESTLVCRMLGVKTNRVEEFVKAGILTKILKYRKMQSNNQEFRLEDVNFLEFNKEPFDEDIVDEYGENIGWEYSTLYDILVNRKYLFAVFWETDEGNIFMGSQLWGMPDKDVETVHVAWSKSKTIVKEGIKLEVVPYGKSVRVNNNLPGISDNGVFHFRPHASLAYYQLADGTTIGSGSIGDSDLLPDGRRMTRQAYWLNRTYIDSQIKPELCRIYPRGKKKQ